jgi:anti-sigma regulatory factor (Ser/Thr protein kinase)
MRAVTETDPGQPGFAQSLRRSVLPASARDDVAILTVHFETPAPVRRWRFDPRWADVSRRAQRELVQELHAAGLGENALLAAEVSFLELMANLVRYAEGVVEVVLERRDDEMILHVVDDGPGFQFSPRLPSDLFSERGRGLFLISRLAAEFTVERSPGGGSHARVILPRSNTSPTTKGTHV